MRIKLGDPVLLDDLLAFLRTVGCVAYATASDELAVVIAGSLTERAACLELDTHLAAWRKRQPHTELAVFDD
jgi:hypothetical protein